MGDRYNGDGQEPCSCIHGGTAAVFTNGSGEGLEEFEREGDISAVSAGKAGVMGRGVLGGWVLCSDGGE